MRSQKTSAARAEPARLTPLALFLIASLLSLPVAVTLALVDVLWL